MIEVYAQPEAALCDGNQSLKPERFARVVAEMTAVARAVGRKLGGDS